MKLGYNTNGFANHSAIDALEVIHDIGFESIAITIDHHCLNPESDSLSEQVGQLKKRLDTYAMRSVIETGARFLLDPKHKHEPTLLSDFAERRNKRVEFLRHCIDMAVELESDCVSLWSGIAREGLQSDVALDRLKQGLEPLIEYAGSRKMTLAFEPEPGMFIDSMSAFDRLLNWVDGEAFQLTIDIGHLYCQGEVPIVDYLQRYSDRLRNVHIEDMIFGVHEHLMFGEGEIHFPPIIQGLSDIGYEGCVNVELSRHSHQAPTAAKQAYDFLRPLFVTVRDEGDGE